MFHKKLLFFILFIQVLIIMNISNLIAQSKHLNEKPINQSLKGIKQMSLDVESYNLEALFSYNYDVIINHENLIKLNIIHRFSEAGIKVINNKYPRLHGPYLYAFIQIKEQKDNMYIFSITFGLRQKVRLARNKNILIEAFTWSNSRIGYASRDKIVESYQNLIYEEINRFIIDYLRAN